MAERSEASREKTRREKIVERKIKEPVYRLKTADIVPLKALHFCSQWQEKRKKERDEASIMETVKRAVEPIFVSFSL